MEVKKCRRIFARRDHTTTNEVHGKIIVIGEGKYLCEGKSGIYLVRLPKDGIATCTCPDFSSHLRLLPNGKYASDGYVCKHILAVESMCGISHDTGEKIERIIAAEALEDVCTAGGIDKDFSVRAPIIIMPRVGMEL